MKFVDDDDDDDEVACLHAYQSAWDCVKPGPTW